MYLNSSPNVSECAKKLKMKNDRANNLKNVLENLSGTYGKYDFIIDEKSDEWARLSMIREYTVPKCVGQMVKVKYEIAISVCVCDSNSDIEIAFVSNMFRKWKNCLEEDGKHIEIYKSEIDFNCHSYSAQKYSEYVEGELAEMIESTEERLKTVLGMERIA
jgi:hypothetical protein